MRQVTICKDSDLGIVVASLSSRTQADIEMGQRLDHSISAQILKPDTAQQPRSVKSLRLIYYCSYLLPVSIATAYVNR
jgi:hypothetical protein